MAVSRNKFVICAVFLGLLAALAIGQSSSRPPATPPKQATGLMTSLPLYWPGGGELSAMLADTHQRHWVRTALEEEYQLVLLDSLAQVDSTQPSEKLRILNTVILAQPAALPPADLVALDGWVRSGGRLLLFADPMLTEETDFGLGDKRRPQDMATVSPLLNRWGLHEVFDPGQGNNSIGIAAEFDSGTVLIPMKMPGRFANSTKSARGGTGNDASSGDGDCQFIAKRIIAVCNIGRGRAVIMLDAHLIAAEPQTEQKKAALQGIIDTAFASE